MAQTVQQNTSQTPIALGPGVDHKFDGTPTDVTNGGYGNGTNAAYPQPDVRVHRQDAASGSD